MTTVTIKPNYSSAHYVDKAVDKAPKDGSVTRDEILQALKVATWPKNLTSTGLSELNTMTDKLIVALDLGPSISALDFQTKCRAYTGSDSDVLTAIAVLGRAGQNQSTHRHGGGKGGPIRYSYDLPTGVNS